MRSDPAPGPHRRPWSESDRAIPRRVVQPLQRFLEVEAASAVVMLGAAVLAVVWANSPWAAVYHSTFGATVELAVGPWHGLSGLTVRGWVNDGAMTLFFFVVALEIKRELVFGELRRPRAAALPVLAALGGMVAPALIYLTLNHGGAAERGWGVPMATDIAFAVAVVTAAGRRVPAAARIFLLTLAVADDLGAIVVIAVFYAADVALVPLVAAVLTVVAAWLLQRLHVRSLLPYAVLGVGCWLLLHHSGVHPTLAGVAFGLLTPAWSWHAPKEFLERLRGLLDSVAHERVAEQGTIRVAAAQTVRLAAEAQSPLDRLEARLSVLVSFVVVPLFALANAGLTLSGSTVASGLGDPVTLGVALGLLVGKTVGIFGTTWLATRTRLLVLPTGTAWRHMLGVSVCAGVGFTVALFVGDIAFDDGALGEAAKLGVFTGSALSGVVGFLVLRLSTRTRARSRGTAPR